MSSSATIAAVQEPQEAVLVGGFFHCFYTGIIIVQASRYLQVYPEDPVGLRIFIAMLVFFAFIQTGLSGYIVWQSTVLNSALGESHVWGFHVFFNGFLCSLTRSYQVFRCWQIVRKWYWMVPLVLLGMGSFAANVIFVSVVTRPGITDSYGCNS